MYLIIIILFTLHKTSLANSKNNANPKFVIKNFAAVYNVKIFGFNVGYSYHNMKCINNKCSIHHTAKPKSYLKWLVNEDVDETSYLEQNTLQWLGYNKKVTRRFKENRQSVIINTTYNRKQDKIIYLEKNRSWGNKKHIYDSLVTPYILQQYIKNKAPIPVLYLQDDYDQDLINFQKIGDENLEIDFNDNDDVQFQSEIYYWQTRKHKTKVWLAANLDYFPIKLEINDLKKDRLITITIHRLSKF